MPHVIMSSTSEAGAKLIRHISDKLAIETLLGCEPLLEWLHASIWGNREHTFIVAHSEEVRPETAYIRCRYHHAAKCDGKLRVSPIDHITASSIMLSVSGC